MLRLSSRPLLAAHLCARVLLAGALLWAPLGVGTVRADAQEANGAGTPGTGTLGTARDQVPVAPHDAASEKAFWLDQELPSEAKRREFEGTSEWQRLTPHPGSDALLEKLRAQFVAGSSHSAGELELLDPAKAVAFYGDFLTQNKDVTNDGVELRVRVSSLAAQLLATSLHNPRRALDVYDWSIALLQGTGVPMWMRLAVERDHLIRGQRGQEKTTEQVQLNAVAPVVPGVVAAPSVVTLGVAAPASPKTPAIGATPDAVTLDAMKGVTASTPAGAVTTKPVTVGVGVPTDRMKTASTVAAVNPFIAPLSSANPVAAPSLGSVSVLPLSPQATKAALVGVPNGVVLTPMKSAPERALMALDSVAAPSALVPPFPSAVSPAGVEAVGIAPLPSAVSTAKQTDVSPIVAQNDDEVIAPRLIGNVAPVGVVSQSEKLQGGNKVVPVTALAVSFDRNTTRRDAALAQIKAGTLSPEDAWQSGALTYDNIVDFFQAGAAEWIINARQKDNGLHHALIVLLLAHEGERFKNLPSVPPYLRLWLADYYQSQGDSKCVEVAESILSQLPKPLTKEANWYDRMPLTFQAIERMGWFYDAVGQNKKCAQTWLRVADYCPRGGWWTGDMYLLSARALVKDGQLAEAKKLRDQVPSVNNGWLSILAAYDEAQPLIDTGKLDEAKAVLLRPSGPETQQADFQIAQNAWLASVSYRQGRLDEAFRYGQKATEAGKQGSFSSDSVHNLYDMGHDVYLRAGGWKTQPIQCDVKEIVLKTNPSHLDQPLYARFRIKTYGDQSVTATVDNPAIQVRVLPVDNWQKNGLEAQEEEKEVVIQVTFKQKTNDGRISSSVLLQDSMVPDSMKRVPVFIRP